MSDYRMVARHVRYWRGVVHKWSTVWPFTGTLSSGNYGTAIAALKTLEQGINYGANSPVNGGLYEIALYDQAVGGVPVSVATYFAWATPGAWVKYTSNYYGSTAYPMIQQAEPALQVEFPAGLSSSGKPVHFRKWFHSVPAIGNGVGSPDILAADITLMVAGCTTQLNVIGGLGAQLGRGSRLASTTPVINSEIGNHQMPRGRRRKALVTASGRYTGPSLLIGPATAGEEGD